MDFATWHRDLLDPNRGHEVPPWARNRETALEIFESMQPPRAKQAETGEVTSLRAEVATLRDEIKRLRLQHAKDIKTLNANFAGVAKIFDVLFGNEDDPTKLGVLGNHAEAISASSSASPIPALPCPHPPISPLPADPVRLCVTEACGTSIKSTRRATWSRPLTRSG